MLDWLEKESIFSIVFGESMHVEVISRCLPVLTFLYEQGQLTPERIEVIFELSHGKHEAFRNPVMKILLELIEIMNLEDLKVFSLLK